MNTQHACTHCFETVSHYASLTDLEHPMETRLALNSWRSILFAPGWELLLPDPGLEANSRFLAWKG